MAVVVAGIIGIIQALFFTLGIVQKTTRLTVNVFRVNALFFHRADGLIISFVHEMLLLKKLLNLGLC